MITSQRQLMAAKEKLKILKDSVLAEYKKEIPEALKVAATGQIEELIHEIESEINDYTNLRNNTFNEIKIFSLDDLMDAPIKYRIAKGMTIEDFAKKVDIHSRQIARYETDHYHNATTETLLKILHCLNVKINGELRL